MALAEGTDMQRKMLQESLDRWWQSLLMFFGPATAKTTGSSKQDLTIKYRIRTKTNEQLRQDFFTKYVPRVLALGLKLPDETMHYDKDLGEWVYQQPDWSEFKKIIANNGPKSQSRLRLRKIAYENNQWVREAMANP
jgi:ring-1,2-phenylacetyl-CoA epoxidase subunit PaaA